MHFTTEGAQFLAQHVYKLLDSRWNLASQAVPGSPIDYTIEGSGGSVGGTNLGGGSGNNERQRERLGHHDQPDHGRAGDDRTDHLRADDHAAENDIDHGSAHDDDAGPVGLRAGAIRPLYGRACSLARAPEFSC